MKWQDYYEKFYEWSESAQLNRISSLVEFTSVDELIEIAENFDEKGASKLINKALNQGVYFSSEEIIKVCEYLNKETAIQLLKQCKERFTAEQIEYLVDFSPLWEDEILKLLNYAVPSDLCEETDFNDFDIEAQSNIPKQKKLGFFATLGLGLLGADILDNILDDNDED